VTEIWSIVLPNLAGTTLTAPLRVSYGVGRWMQRVRDRLEKLERKPIIVTGNKLLAKNSLRYLV
jgi:hypothetical protein